MPTGIHPAIQVRESFARKLFCLGMISAQTRSAFAARESRFPLSPDRALGFRVGRRLKRMGLVMQHRGELVQLVVAKAGGFDRGDR